MIEIGNRIKELRLRNDMTQEMLADRCELTKGYISQVENDLTCPSISTLRDILVALGSSLKEFFGDDDDNIDITFTPNDHFEKVTDNGLINWLVPTSQQNEMEPITIELEVGQQSERDIPHDGEEFGYVLSGCVKLTVGKIVKTCKSGDSFYFRARKTHFLTNTGSTVAKILWVTSPPNF